MNFEGDPVKKLGTVAVEKLREIEKIVISKYGQKWQQRSLKIFPNLSTLKIITPTNIDRIDAETESELRTLVEPIVTPFLNPTEKIVYLDLSLIPPEAKTDVHFDFAWIHALSRRIIIPLKVNESSLLTVLDEKNKIKTYNLLLGDVYEFNNQLLHTAGNYGTEDRINIIVDIIETEVHDYLVKTKKIDKMYCGKLNVFYIDKVIQKKIQTAMKNALKKSKDPSAYEIF